MRRINLLIQQLTKKFTVGERPVRLAIKEVLGQYNLSLEDKFIKINGNSVHLTVQGPRKSEIILNQEIIVNKINSRLINQKQWVKRLI
jgi:hypothetical protein